jgi:hypothetical protein
MFLHLLGILLEIQVGSIVKQSLHRIFPCPEFDLLQLKQQE